MATLNITYRGLSTDYLFDGEVPLGDDDVRRIAVEVIRSGGIPQLAEEQILILDSAFNEYVVDRFDGGRVYLRPKVPFG